MTADSVPGDAPPDQGGRPLTARSVLASTLLGAHPQALAVRHLVHVAGLFDVNENRARVALSRMVGSGEATTDGSGSYRLAGHLLQRQQRQAASRAGRTGWWKGEWHVVVLSAGATAAGVRDLRRRALTQARLGELRQGVWIRPDNLPVRVETGAAGDSVLDGSVTMKSTLSGDGHALAASLWDLGNWSTRADTLLGALDALEVSDSTQLAPGFVLSASVLRHFQADPLLPEQLLPEHWPGGRLRARYDDWDSRYRSVLAEWSRAR